MLLSAIPGVFFVVDSTDRGRLGTARELLYEILNHADMANKTVIILANKRDLMNAIPLDEMVKDLGLSGLPLSCTAKWKIFPSSAESGEGLMDVLDTVIQVMAS